MTSTPEQLFGPAGTPKVVVVGAGFGGIATGVKLKRAGIDTFTIYEASRGIGASLIAAHGSVIRRRSRRLSPGRCHTWPNTNARIPACM